MLETVNLTFYRLKERTLRENLKSSHFFRFLLLVKRYLVAVVFQVICTLT